LLHASSAHTVNTMSSPFHTNVPVATACGVVPCFEKMLRKWCDRLSSVITWPGITWKASRISGRTHQGPGSGFRQGAPWKNSWQFLAPDIHKWRSTLRPLRIWEHEWEQREVLLLCETWKLHVNNKPIIKVGIRTSLHTQGKSMN